MDVTIAAERPDAPEATDLILELEAHLEAGYPRESRHGFSVEKLMAAGVAFFLIRADRVPAGCGGVLVVDGAFAELKRMYVRPAFRGRGLGLRMLNHLGDYARARGITVLRLETGVYQRDAIRLYERSGFYRIPPFGQYTDDPLSLCYEKRLA